jgi:Planctomycete cytochrome C
MSLQIGGLGRWGVVLGMTACLVGGAGVISANDGSGRAVLVAQKTQKKKGVAKRADDEMAGPAGKATATTPAPADGSLSFKRDVAPILIANCAGCHSGNGAGIRNGKLDMTTFEKLMAGGKRGKDIIGGDSENSHLVLMIKGEETPKMPPNNGQRGFAEEAAEKIETWVKQGARLDAGLSASDPMTKYAASIDDLRRAELSKLSPEERDKIAEQTGRERWKKATKTEPELTTSKTGHFLLLSNLPKERATKLLQTMEAQYTLTNKMLSTSRAPVLNPAEKISLYVFKDTIPFVEFVRTNENQEVESGEQARAKLGIETPYIVAIDPAMGGEEVAQTPTKKGARGKKKAEESAGGPERTLAGVLTEQLVAAAANKAGKPPRWVSLGLGAFTASHLEPSSPYYRNLRKETAESFRIGWQAKAQEALGGEGKLETTRAIGFSLFEWMAANAPSQVVANFVQVMLEGQAKLDDAIGNCLNLNRQEFLDGSGLWLSERYGRL